MNLILTNPPYVVNGSGDMKALATATGLYKCGGLGLEALFMEWIVKSLAEDGTALIVIPDGILSNLANKKLREYILDRCTIEGIISLPINTFFGTPKKTYILAIKKKYTDDLRVNIQCIHQKPKMMGCSPQSIHMIMMVSI